MHAHRSIRFLTPPSLGEVKEYVRAELLAMTLTQRLGCPVTVETTSTYEELIERAERGEAEVIWATAELCDRLAPNARAILRAVRGGSAEYHAAFICRADDPVTLESLQGTEAAWLTPWSAAGYLLPRAHLLESGIDPDAIFGDQRFWQTYRRALGAVLDGEADVAAIYCARPDERTVRASLAQHVGAREVELVPFAYTGTTRADGVVLTQTLPESQVAKVIAALQALGSEGPGLHLHPLLSIFDTEAFSLEHPEGERPPPVRSSSTDGLVVIEVGSDLRCLRTWSQSGRVFGHSGEVLAGHSLEEALGPEAAAPVASLVRESLRNGAGSRIEFRLASRHERVRWFSAEFALCSAGPKDDGSVGTLLLRDVTDERKMEDELFRLASYPLVMPDPVLEIDTDGTVRYANRAAHVRFPGLLTQGADHPIVAAMLAVNRSPRRGLKSVLREVQVDGQVWKITVVSPPDADFIRAFVVDLTEAGREKRPSRDELLKMLKSVDGR